MWEKGIIGFIQRGLSLNIAFCIARSLTSLLKIIKTFETKTIKEGKKIAQCEFNIYTNYIE